MGKKYAVFDQNGFPKAFYDDEIHENIPLEAIPISEQDWLEFINNQGRRIWDFQTSTVKVYTPPPPTLDELKTRKLQELQATAKSYIERFYPEIKQRSDEADEKYWLPRLLAQNSTYTADSIYKSAYQSALNILSGTSDLPTEISNYPTAEQQAWEQLIKIALRVSFVQEVKEEYYAKKAQIEQAQSEADLNAVDMTFTTPYPQGA